MHATSNTLVRIMKLRIKGAVALLILCLLATTSGSAQVAAKSLVNVNLYNLRKEIARKIKVDVSRIPPTVWSPIALAADVCDVSPSILTSQVRQGVNTCVATSTNTALDTIVQDQIKRQSGKE